MSFSTERQLLSQLNDSLFQRNSKFLNSAITLTKKNLKMGKIILISMLSMNILGAAFEVVSGGSQSSPPRWRNFLKRLRRRSPPVATAPVTPPGQGTGSTTGGGLFQRLRKRVSNILPNLPGATAPVAPPGQGTGSPTVTDVIAPVTPPGQGTGSTTGGGLFQRIRKRVSNILPNLPGAAGQVSVGGQENPCLDSTSGSAKAFACQVKGVYKLKDEIEEAAAAYNEASEKCKKKTGSKKKTRCEKKLKKIFEKTKTTIKELLDKKNQELETLRSNKISKTRKVLRSAAKFSVSFLGGVGVSVGVSAATRLLFGSGGGAASELVVALVTGLGMGILEAGSEAKQIGDHNRLVKKMIGTKVDCLKITLAMIQDQNAADTSPTNPADTSPTDSETGPNIDLQIDDKNCKSESKDSSTTDFLSKINNRWERVQTEFPNIAKLAAYSAVLLNGLDAIIPYVDKFLELPDIMDYFIQLGSGVATLSGGVKIALGIVIGEVVAKLAESKHSQLFKKTWTEKELAVLLPTAEQPTTEQPTTVTEQPAAEQPAVEHPTTEQPTTEQPPTDQPAAGQPAVGQPAAGETAQVAVDVEGVGRAATEFAYLFAVKDTLKKSIP